MQEVESHSEFVLMPWDDKREIIHVRDDVTATSTRWELVQRQLNLSRPITSCTDLINIIKSYNINFEKNGRQTLPQWKCLVLQKYFASLDTSEINRFFQENGVLSTIRNLSLQLKELVPRLKLLKTNSSSTIKLHQMQIASLLANAFLCTFPKGKADCPSINFNTLYESNSTSVMSHNIEKIKCIMNYFSRIHKKQPTGHVSFHRLYIPDHKFPRWDKTTVELTSLRVDSTEKIEDQDGYMQVDFANRYVGGGVLGRGCVQEEIRFVICPELIVARLFTESLADNEAMLVVGAERFCRYTGYSNTFKFAGDYEDQTPMDENGHRKSFLVVVDALCFNQFSEQFRESRILRELKKAYVGFKPMSNENPLPLATGNWGCGAFGGDPQLKSLLQLMASSQARRNVLYLTFGDIALKKQIDEIYKLLKENSVNVGKLYRIIRLYNREKEKNQRLFDFLREILGNFEKNKTEERKSVGSIRAPSPSSSAAVFIPSKQNTVSEAGNVKSENIQEGEMYIADLEEMIMDFESLDEEIKNHYSSSSRIDGRSDETPTAMDTVWFENEVGFGTRNRQHNGEDNMDVSCISPSLFPQEKEMKEMKSSKAEEVEIKVSESGSLKRNFMKESVISAKEGRTSPQEKRLVQKKITDCFFKN